MANVYLLKKFLIKSSLQGYANFSTNYQLVIKSEADNETVLKVVEQLIHSDNPTPEENELYDLLVTSIEKFEQEHYQPGVTSTPQSILYFLMEQNHFWRSLS